MITPLAWSGNAKDGKQGQRMKKEIKLSEALGKTLAGFESSFTSGQAVLVFADGTFSTIGIDRGRGYGGEEIAERELNILDFGNDKLIALGITSEEELDEKANQFRKAVEEIADKCERDEYERLKRKFEG